MAPKELVPADFARFRGFSLAPPRPYHYVQLREGEMCILWSMRASMHQDTHASRRAISTSLTPTGATPLDWVTTFGSGQG